MSDNIILNGSFDISLNDNSGVPLNWYTDASGGDIVDLSNTSNYLRLRYGQSIYQDVSNISINNTYRLSWNYYSETGFTGNSLQVSLDNSISTALTSTINNTAINKITRVNNFSFFIYLLKEKPLINLTCDCKILDSVSNFSIKKSFLFWKNSNLTS